MEEARKDGVKGAEPGWLSSLVLGVEFPSSHESLGGHTVSGQGKKRLQTSSRWCLAPGGKNQLSQPSLCVSCSGPAALSARLQTLGTSVSLLCKASPLPGVEASRNLAGSGYTLGPVCIEDWTGSGAVSKEEIPCWVWGRAGCPRFSFLSPSLGQIHPLDQSKLGPIPAVRLGTGFASLLQGVGASVPSWQEGAVRAKDRMGLPGRSEFPGTVQTEAGCVFGET